METVQSELHKVRFATEVSELTLGLGFVLFGTHVCYEILKAISLLAEGQFVPITRVIRDFELASIRDLDAPSANQLPKGLIQIFGVLTYVILLAGPGPTEIPTTSSPNADRPASTVNAAHQSSNTPFAPYGLCVNNQCRPQKIDHDRSFRTSTTSPTSQILSPLLRAI